MVKVEDLPTEIPPGTYRILHQSAYGVFGSGKAAKWIWLLVDGEGNIGLYAADAGRGDWETAPLVIP